MPYHSAYLPFFRCPARLWQELCHCQWQLYTVRAFSANANTRPSVGRRAGSSPCRRKKHNNRKQAISGNLPSSSFATYSVRTHSATHTTASLHPRAARVSLSVTAKHKYCPHSFLLVLLPDAADVHRSSAGRKRGTAMQTTVPGKVIDSYIGDVFSDKRTFFSLCSYVFVLMFFCLNHFYSIRQTQLSTACNRSFQLLQRLLQHRTRTADIQPHKSLTRFTEHGAVIQCQMCLVYK